MRMLLSWFAGIFDAIRERGAEETRQTDPHYHWLREQQEAARAAVDAMQQQRQPNPVEREYLKRRLP